MDQERENYRDSDRPPKRRIFSPVRAVLVLALALTVVCFGCHWHRERQAARYYDATYNWIAPGEPQSRVCEAMWSPGRTEAPAGWPRIVGDVAGYQQLTVAKPDTKMWWRVWTVPGRRGWIAVAFVNDGTGGSLTEPTVVTKRSGAGTAP
jgi:hypothetical protein